MKSLLSAAHVSGYTAVVFSGAIFGFFYAWVCSTMWGLDNADPRVAIAAMQQMNASVRNAVFFPAFFLTPLVLLGAALIAYAGQHHLAAALFTAGALLYAVGGMGLTLAINVPMNEALAQVNVPTDLEPARAIWSDYSLPWQYWNTVRTLASGVTVLLAVLGVAALAPRFGH